MIIQEDDNDSNKAIVASSLHLLFISSPDFTNIHHPHTLFGLSLYQQSFSVVILQGEFLLDSVTLGLKLRSVPTVYKNVITRPH